MFTGEKWVGEWKSERVYEQWKGHNYIFRYTTLHISHIYNHLRLQIRERDRGLEKWIKKEKKKEERERVWVYERDLVYRSKQVYENMICIYVEYSYSSQVGLWVEQEVAHDWQDISVVPSIMREVSTIWTTNKEIIYVSV